MRMAYHLERYSKQYPPFPLSTLQWNAGRAIDDRMQDQGFNVSVRLNRSNGFLFGGNEYLSY